MAAKEYLCKVTSFKELTPTVFEILFQPSEPLDFKAGQFISIVIPGAGPKGRDLRRAYSIASEPKKYPIELCVKLVEDGPGTQYLHSLRAGDTFRGTAPYGDFLYETPPNKHVCFISTGTGIAPFRSMLLSDEYRQNPPLSAYCLFGAREEDEILYEDELKNLPGLKWVFAVSRPKNLAGNFYRGRVTHWLREQGTEFPWTNMDYYLCGGGAMIDEVKALLTEKGVDKESVYQEVYYKPPKEKAAVTP